MNVNGFPCFHIPPGVLCSFRIKLNLQVESNPWSSLFLKIEAAGMLREVSGSEYGYDPEGTDVANRKAIEKWQTHFAQIR